MEIPLHIFGKLNQIKCYEIFNHKKLYQLAHLSIIQLLALRSSHIHFKVPGNNLLFNGPFMIPLVRIFYFLHWVHM